MKQEIFPLSTFCQQIRKDFSEKKVWDGNYNFITGIKSTKNPFSLQSFRDNKSNKMPNFITPQSAKSITPPLQIEQDTFYGLWYFFPGSIIFVLESGKKRQKEKLMCFDTVIMQCIKISFLTNSLKISLISHKKLNESQEIFQK